MADWTHSMDNGQAAIKAQLLELLGDTYSRLTALEEKIDPTPVPLPDSIRTAALYTCKRLVDEQAALLGSLLEGSSALRRLIAYSAEEALLEDVAHGEVPHHE